MTDTLMQVVAVVNGQIMTVLADRIETVESFATRTRFNAGYQIQEYWEVRDEVGVLLSDRVSITDANVAPGSMLYVSRPPGFGG